MINFKKYPQLTKVVIPSNITLSNADFRNMFSNMQNLKTC